MPLQSATFYTEGSTRFLKCTIFQYFTWQLHIHSHHLVLIVDSGSCLQQSLDYLDVSILSSYHQRNIALLCESKRQKQSLLVEIIVVEQRGERKRERQPNSKIRTLMKGKSLVHKECSIQVHKKDMCTQHNIMLPDCNSIFTWQHVHA